MRDSWYAASASFGLAFTATSSNWLRLAPSTRVDESTQSGVGGIELPRAQRGQAHDGYRSPRPSISLGATSEERLTTRVRRGPDRLG